MPLFNTSDLTRFWNQGENEISHERPFLVDRISLNIQTNVALYTLPDYVVSIKRITYLGKKLDPLPKRNQREVFQAATQAGNPFWYVYNNIGANLISLFPTPEQNLPTVTNVWDTDIPNSCIVEFFRATDNNTFKIPSYLRRQLLKYYTAKRAYAIDGAGGNLKLVKYYTEKWMSKKMEFVEWLDFLHTKPRKFCVDEIVSSNYFPGEPVLPIDQFGTSVDEGY